MADSSYHSRLIPVMVVCGGGSAVITGADRYPGLPLSCPRLPCIFQPECPERSAVGFSVKPDGGWLTVRINSRYQVNGAAPAAAAVEGLGFAIPDQTFVSAGFPVTAHYRLSG